jgi:hypothetical protein
MRFKDEDGQAIIIVALAMSIFLIGAIGLAVDGSNLYTQRQMAQTAADAAAQAGILSIFDGTTGGGPGAFSIPPVSSGFTCSNSAVDARTPCSYANKNGFGGTAADTVTVSFPTSAPGVSLSPDFPTDNLIQVSVSRSVNTTLMRLLGPTATTVTATATAAIVSNVAPVPIIITHPTLQGSFSMNGGINVQICGGPSRSIQVNSNSGTAGSAKGTSGTIDLSHAGPLDTNGTCTTGTGADFGIYGGPAGPAAPFTFNPGTKPGKYLQPASPIPDPLASVVPPTVPTVLGSQNQQVVAGTGQCPAAASPQNCTVLTPGHFPNGISLTGTTALVKPGIYYIEGGGFSCTSTCNMVMFTGTADPPSPAGTGTGWDGTATGGGMLVYNTGTVTTTTAKNGKKTTTSTYQPFNVGANGSLNLVGSPAGSSYKGILFFQDPASPFLSHTLGGGGGLQLLGTIYLNNPVPLMAAGQYQALSLQGTPGSTTHIDGEIIVGTLSMGGNAKITMNLNSTSVIVVDQVAMVN